MCARVTDAVAECARRLRDLSPSCGPVRLVGIDGHAGSGKTSLARALAAALDDAPVLHLDDFATHTASFGWVDAVADQVLRPFAAGRPADHDVYDWRLRRFASRRTVPAAPVVLIEGVGAGRRALRPALAHLLWMEVAAAESWARGRHRDGPEQAAFWDDWIPAEQRHFAHDPSRPHADVSVRRQGSRYRFSPR